MAQYLDLFLLFAELEAEFRLDLLEEESEGVNLVVDDRLAVADANRTEDA
jgi:hypothetical protein